MKSNYKRLGDYIQSVSIRNRNLENKNLIGLSIEKKFIPSISNTIGTDMSTYRILQHNQFAYCAVTSRNGEKVTIAHYQKNENAIISQAYDIFDIVDKNKLSPEYLMMWFRRPEFDRYARFKSHGSVREMFEWEELCETLLPVPSIEKQREIVNEYNVIENRIKLNEQIIQKLEETAQAIYKQWFVEFEFPNEDGKPYKSSGGEMVWNEELGKEIPMGWEVGTLGEICTIIDNRGKTPPCVSKKTKFPLIEISAIRNNYRVIDLDKCEKYVEKIVYNNWFRSGHPKKQDILFSTVGSLAEMKLYWKQSGVIAQNIVAFRCIDNISFYVYQYLINNKNHLSAYEIGSVQASIKVSQVINFKIILPDKSNTNSFNIILYPITNQINIIYNENQKLKELKNLLLSKLSTLEN